MMIRCPRCQCKGYYSVREIDVSKWFPKNHLQALCAHADNAVLTMIYIKKVQRREEEREAKKGKQ